jgi:5-hydroxyisourate hydrolase
MNRVSTHILDTVRGKPAADVPVRLERMEESGNWLLLGSALTDQDGRCGQLLHDDNILMPGIYRMKFDTGSYFADARMKALYPMVEVTFQVGDGETTFHIPLLLSPNGYTTYRGT